MADLTPEEQLQFQIENARRNAASSGGGWGETLSGSALDQARLQQTIAQQGWLSGQHNLDSPVIPTIPTAPTTTSDLISRLAGGVTAPVATPTFRDSKDITPIPLPAPVDPDAAWKALAGPTAVATVPGIQSALPSRIAPMAAVAAAPAVDYGQQVLDSTAAAVKQYQADRATGRGAVASAITASPDYVSRDAAGDWTKLNASTPMPTVATPTGLGGFLSRLVGSIDAHGRWSPTNMTAYDTHLKDTTQAEMDKKLAQRNTDMLLQMGFSKETVADINKSNELKTAKNVDIAKLNDPTDAVSLQATLGATDKAATLSQTGAHNATTDAREKAFHVDTVNYQNQALALHRQQLAQQRNPEAERQQTIRDAAQAVLEGKKNPGAPGTLTAEQGQAVVNSLKFGLKPAGADKPVIADIAPATSLFETQVIPYLKGVPNAAAIQAQYSAVIGSAILSGTPASVALQQALERIKAQYPLQK